MDIYCLSTKTTTTETWPTRMTSDFIFNRQVLETQDSASLPPVDTLEKSVAPQRRTVQNTEKRMVHIYHFQSINIDIYIDIYTVCIRNL